MTQIYADFGDEFLDFFDDTFVRYCGLSSKPPRQASPATPPQEGNFDRAFARHHRKSKKSKKHPQNLRKSA
jgi:hypothetical protein